MKTRANGFFLPLAIAFVGVCLVIAAALVAIFRYNSRASTYLQSMNMTYRLAETGLSNAMKQLAASGSLSDFDTSEIPGPDPGSYYQSTVALRHYPVDPVFYVVTSARRTVSGRTYHCKLHAFVRVTNTNEYFAAIADELVVSHPVDIRNGKIYAPKLAFAVDGNPATQTYVKKAEYVESVQTVWPDGSLHSWVTPDDKAEVKISEPADGNPSALSAPLVFPQILDQDVIRYRALAGPHTVTSDFSGEIYPPGYNGYTSNASGDVYAHHTTNNKEHIYFFDGDITVTGRVHGQVMFFATGNIYISKNLVVADDSDFPGAGVEFGSAAHQVVLLTKRDVIIRPDVAVDLVGGTEEDIQAMIIAPHGSLVPMSYGDDHIHAKLSLNFTGSMIMSTMGKSPRLPEIFRGGRTYSYMDSLRTSPPPYLPNVSEVYSYQEQTGGVDEDH